MKNRLLMTTAAIALIAGTGLATAQDRKEGAAPSPAPAAQQNAPAEKTAPPAAQRGNDKAMDKSHGGPSARPDTKAEMKNDAKPSSSAQAPTSASDKKVEGDTKSSTKADMKADSKSDDKAGMKASDNKDSKTNTRASDSKSTDTNSATQNNAQMKDGKPSTSTTQTTTGQGAAGARSVNLTTEQKTTIKTVIREQKVAPVTNVNFSISVGARIPREVRHHPLPARIVEVYPAWRGFEYILVRDEILVIDPNTLEIVAVIEA